MMQLSVKRSEEVRKLDNTILGFISHEEMVNKIIKDTIYQAMMECSDGDFDNISISIPDDQLTSYDIERIQEEVRMAFGR